MMLVFKDSPQYSGWKAGSSIMGDETESVVVQHLNLLCLVKVHIFSPKKEWSQQQNKAAHNVLEIIFSNTMKQ